MRAFVYRLLLLLLVMVVSILLCSLITN